MTAITKNLKFDNGNLIIDFYESFPQTFDIYIKQDINTVECNKDFAVRLIKALQDHYGLTAQQMQLDLNGGMG